MPRTKTQSVSSSRNLHDLFVGQRATESLCGSHKFGNNLVPPGLSINVRNDTDGNGMA